ncbi:MAG: polyprenyl synthetase family protein [Streptococcaceae bacterium]|nr:polyprenyl synthetase family protein [Streptococcaceae bacterium]
MVSSISIKNKEVEKAIIEMIQKGGKMLRPTFLILFSKFGESRNREKIAALAASVELLHIATLIHDDIVDESKTRRGLETIAHRFGNDVAVYAGDYLFISVFKILSKHSKDLESIHLHSNHIERILNGEIGQMNLKYKTTQTIDQYLDNISGKTAELFGMSSFIGASESGLSAKQSKQAFDIGRNIGIAFQIMDDLLDYTSKQDELGKPVLEDVKEGIYTLPLLLALEENPYAILPILEKKADIPDSELIELKRKIQETNAIQRCKKLIQNYTDKASKLIEKLPDSGIESKRLLLLLTQELTKRTN